MIVEGMGNDNVKRYSNNVKDTISPGITKRYMNLTLRKVKVWMRARLDLLDPTPRRPYRASSIWNCKFCETMEQTTEHYVVHCAGVNEMFTGIDRQNLFVSIQTLDMDNPSFEEATKKLEMLYESLKK